MGVWHNGQKKLGVVFTISFEKPYPIDAELPLYKAEEATYQFTGIASSLVIHVLIDEDKVGKISTLASTGEN